MDARAALPQNCSNARLSVSPKSENGTGVPDVSHESAMTGKLTAIVMFCAEARATNCSADMECKDAGACDPGTLHRARQQFRG